MLLRNVDGHIGRRLEEVIEQEARLRATPTAVLDEQTLLPEHLRHRAGVVPHDAQLGAREIVLVERANLLEELRPPLIVEELGGQLLLRLAQAAEHFFTEAAELRLEVGEPELAGLPRLHVTRDHASFASRIPVNGQRALAGKKLR